MEASKMILSINVTLRIYNFSKNVDINWHFFIYFVYKYDGVEFEFIWKNLH